MSDEISSNVVTVYHAVKILNDALSLDQLAVTSLFHTIVPCGKLLADSPSVEAMAIGESYGVTILGIINAIFSYSDTGQYRIFPVYGDDLLIEEFRLGKIN